MEYNMVNKIKIKKLLTIWVPIDSTWPNTCEYILFIFDKQLNV